MPASVGRFARFRHRLCTGLERPREQLRRTHAIQRFHDVVGEKQLDSGSAGVNRRDEMVMVA